MVTISNVYTPTQPTKTTQTTKTPTVTSTPTRAKESNNVNDVMRQHANIARQQHQDIDFNPNIIALKMQQARSLENRKLSTNDDYNNTPTLQPQTAEHKFSHLNGLRSKGVVASYAQKFLRRAGQKKGFLDTTGARVDDEEDEEEENRGILAKRIKSKKTSSINKDNFDKNNIKNILEETLGRGGDGANPTNTFIIADEAIKDKNIDPEFKAKLQEFIDDNYSKHKTRINADINIADEASIYGGNNKKKITQFTEVYYELIKAQNIGDVFKVFVAFSKDSKHDIEDNTPDRNNVIKKLFTSFRTSTNLALLGKATKKDESGATLPTSNINSFIFSKKSGKSIKPSAFMHDKNTAHASIGFMDKNQKLFSSGLSIDRFKKSMINFIDELHGKKTDKQDSSNFTGFHSTHHTNYDPPPPFSKIDPAAVKN